MKRIFLAIAVLCYTGAVYGQDGGRIHRSEFVPFDTREDADALNRKNTDRTVGSTRSSTSISKTRARPTRSASMTAP